MVKEKDILAVFQYTNRKGNVLYLHQKINAKGTKCYYFSKNIGKNTLEKVPEGYEVWEHPETSQLFVRKKQPRIITEIEENYIHQAMKKYSPIKYYRIDIQGEHIVIYVIQNTSAFSEITKLFPFSLPESTDNLIEQFGRYQAMLKFTLRDHERRHFSAQRWCFRGAIDDWMTIFSLADDTLETLCQKLFTHLGQESYYELI